MKLFSDKNQKSKVKFNEIEQEVFDALIDEYNDAFENILNLNEKNFFENILKNVKAVLGEAKVRSFSKVTIAKVLSTFKIDYYMPDFLSLKNLKEVMDSLGPKDTNKKIPILSIDDIFAHCKDCSKCYHLCGEELLRPVNFDFIICLKCKMIYKKSMIHLYCKECKEEYFSYIIDENEEEYENFFPATWDNYHCPNFIYEEMTCPNCDAMLYYNDNNKLLKCFECNFSSKLKDMKWKCEICEQEFTSNVKEYVRFETKPKVNCVRNALVNKIPARPSECLCCGAEPRLYIFKHSGKNCKGGNWYLSYLQKKEMAVCSECRLCIKLKDVSWVCPRCGLDFLCKRNKNVNSNNVSYLLKPKITVRRDNHAKIQQILNSNYVNTIGNNNNDVFNNSYKQSMIRNKSFDKHLSSNLLFNKNKVNLKKVSNKTNEEYVKPKKMVTSQILKNYKIISGNNSKYVYKNNKINSNSSREIQSINKYLIGKNIDSPQKNKVLTKDLSEPYFYSKIKDSENHNRLSSFKENNKYKIAHKNLPSEKNNENNDSNKNINLNVNLNININNYLEKSNRKAVSQKSNIKLSQILEPDENFIPEDFKIIKQIGEGTFGKIYSSEWIKNKKKYAMKKMILHTEDDVKINKQNTDLLYNFIQNTKCDGVIKVYGAQCEKKKEGEYIYYVLMELAGADWENEIKNRFNTKKYYAEGELLLILRQLVKTFALLQKNNITHRDVKPQNILIVDELYKICDFGEAKIIGSNAVIHQTIRGTELYMSPILFRALNCRQLHIIHNTYKSDVFSLGMCVLLAASLTYHSLYDIRELKNMDSIKNILVKYLIAKYSYKFVDILMKMLEINEDLRPDFLDLEKIVGN